MVLTLLLRVNLAYRRTWFIGAPDLLYSAHPLLGACFLTVLCIVALDACTDLTTWTSGMAE